MPRPSRPGCSFRSKSQGLARPAGKQRRTHTRGPGRDDLAVVGKGQVRQRVRREGTDLEALLAGLQLAADHGAGEGNEDRALAGGRACSIASQTRSAVNGIWSCVTPSGASASSTALTMAGGAATQPDSPTPLAPSGLNGEGVTVSSSS